MSTSTITQPNVKGQIVIPKKIRDELGIGPDTQLYITKQGQSVLISPLFYSQGEDKSSLEWRLQVLRETQGAWGPETADERKHRLAIERKERIAVKKMREAW